MPSIPQPLTIRQWSAGALCVIPCASAQAQSTDSVQVYGLIDAMARRATNAPTSGATNLADGAYTGSRFGVRGREDLGGGMTAYFSLEQGIDPSTGSLQQSTASNGLGQSAAPNGRAFGRESLVGLSTPWGTVSLGRQYTEAHLMSGRFQPQANPSEAALSVLSGHHVARQDNMLRYAHKWGAFGISANVVARETNGKAHGLSLSYNAAPVELVAYAQDMDTNAAGADTRKIRGLGGNVAVNKALKVYLGMMTRSQDVSLQKNQVLTGGLNYNVTDLLIWTVGYTDDHQKNVNAGHRKLVFTGLDYFLSKRTDAYIVVDNNRITGSYPVPSFMGGRGAQTGLGVGLRHRF